MARKISSSPRSEKLLSHRHTDLTGNDLSRAPSSLSSSL